MKFDDWMLARDKSYVPTDDSKSLRLLRECWFSRDAEVAEIRRGNSAAVSAYNTCSEENDKLSQQLAHREAWIVVLREFLPYITVSGYEREQRFLQALAATDDLSGVILCHAEPYAFAVVMPDRADIVLVHDLEDAEELLTNNNCEVQELFSAWEPK